MRWCAGRRALLAGAGAAGLLAACGDDPAPPASAPAAAAPATSAAPSAPSPATSLASTADVPVGGGAVIGDVLVVQPVAGTFKAYDAACPHKGVKLGVPKDGVATCPAHNSTFAIADGARISGPATSGLKEIAIKVDAGRITQA
ncbi:Rieske (2Fe-2S) protein [Dactylosporangium sp. NBC_01737]|uniref:Rieske (2Fe-2S) protein n=1 Tax=Dactylosporangium sp. NBC_01737 TaxID=2975959 RepID=UPI002E110656|nr:Rieske (2Fe-2S) protein [Dactylosporangium sp. NBC_01737]